MGNIFDILGPVMVGPSSSHTIGPERAARISTPAGFLETRLRLGELAGLLPEQFLYCHRTNGQTISVLT